MVLPAGSHPLGTDGIPALNRWTPCSESLEWHIIAKVAERMVIDSLLRALLSVTLQEMVKALEGILATLSICRGDQRDMVPGLCRGLTPRRQEPGLHWEISG